MENLNANEPIKMGFAEDPSFNPAEKTPRRMNWNKFAALLLLVLVCLAVFFVWRVNDASNRQVEACGFLVDGKNFSYTPDLFNRLNEENATCVKFCRVWTQQTIEIEK